MNIQYIVKQNEDLKQIATYQLNNPEKWIIIAMLNNLQYPYVVATQQLKLQYPNTVAPGDKIILPDANINDAGNDSVYNSILTESQFSFETLLFGTDIAVTNGQLQLINSNDGVDFLTVSGLQNMKQAITNKLLVRKGSLIYHRNYGTLIPTYIGKTLDQRVLQQVTAEAHNTIMEDPRVSAVLNLSVDISGNYDYVNVNAVVKLIGNVVAVIATNYQLGG